MADYDIYSQLVHFDGLLNARDLGKMPLKDGKVFPERFVIRSDSPSDLTPEQCEKIKAYGVNRVIDLRSSVEVEDSGNPFEDMPGVDFYNIPLFIGDPYDDNNETIMFLRTHLLGDFYVKILQELGDKVCEVLRLISDNKDGITMYHCAHGKDRTGLISALLYLLAGASRENIIENYKCSFEFMKPILEPAIASIEPELKHILNSDQENMEILLNFIESSYNGDITLYLKEQGMTVEEIEKLRSRMI